MSGWKPCGLQTMPSVPSVPSFVPGKGLRTLYSLRFLLQGMQMGTRSVLENVGKVLGVGGNLYMAVLRKWGFVSDLGLLLKLQWYSRRRSNHDKNYTLVARQNTDQKKGAILSGNDVSKSKMTWNECANQ